MLFPHCAGACSTRAATLPRACGGWTGPGGSTSCAAGRCPGSKRHGPIFSGRGSGGSMAAGSSSSAHGATRLRRWTTSRRTSSRCDRQAPRSACSRYAPSAISRRSRSEEHTSELQSQFHLVCRLLLEKKKNDSHASHHTPHTKLAHYHRSAPLLVSPPHLSHSTDHTLAAYLARPHPG